MVATGASPPRPQSLRWNQRSQRVVANGRSVAGGATYQSMQKRESAAPDRLPISAAQRPAAQTRPCRGAVPEAGGLGPYLQGIHDMLAIAEGKLGNVQADDTFAQHTTLTNRSAR